MDLLTIISVLCEAAIEGRQANLPGSLSCDEWKLLLGVCAAQRIHTFVFDALPQAGVPEDIMAIWTAQAAAVEKANGLVNAVVSAQERAWRELGLNYALLKGPTLAWLYPVPAHRHCGDIDWWLGDGPSWDAALERVKLNVAETIREDSDGDVHYRLNGVVVEHHRDWSHLSSRRLRKAAGAPELVSGRLCPEDTLLMLLCHILHHVAWEGVNLKQVVDLALAFKAYGGAYDRTCFIGRLKRLGLVKWAALLASVVAEVTGVSIGLEGEVSERDRRRFLSVLFDARPSFLSRFLLMWRLCRAECVARYWHLALGRLRRAWC